ncbi:hypothetical protein LR48_Vigan07g059400 [Vigna angularis]|uniref:Uncharacterized protein n=1 Tax=Phaseolus angularis TaxID=3914 RepID=A0A0L9UVK5_PHAAN|nr:hypothetical protein LR48_Vigan07g059400 [Vigna angularis]
MIVELWWVVHSWWPLLLYKAIANGFHPTTLTRIAQIPENPENPIFQPQNFQISFQPKAYKHNAVSKQPTMHNSIHTPGVRPSSGIQSKVRARVNR